MPRPDRNRRQYGTGSIYQRPDGRWIGSAEAGWSRTGVRRRIRVVAKTEADAKRKLEAKRRALATADRMGTLTTHTTVKTWADTWLPIYQRKARPKTYAGAASAVRRWIVPTIGTRPLAALTPGDIRAVHLAIERAGRKSTTARVVGSVLGTMLRAAILEGHPVPDRVLLVEAPAKAAHDRTAIPVDDAIKLLQQAAKTPTAARWVAALLQGMRQAECLGLTWAAVDLDAGTADISWQLQPVPYLDRDARTFLVPRGYDAKHLTGAWHLTRPKTSKGSRVIPLVPWMVTALTAWKAIAPTNPWGLIWSDIDTRAATPKPAPRSGRADRAEWLALQARAGVAHPAGRPYTLHEARHTTATLLMELGIDESVRTAIMGHSSITVTRGYQHASQAAASAAMAAMAEKLRLDQLEQPRRLTAV